MKLRRGSCCGTQSYTPDQQDTADEWDMMDKWQKLEVMKQVWSTHTTGALLKERDSVRELLSHPHCSQEDRVYFSEVLKALDQIITRRN